jgi:heme-degrading monooxygenase HmoA
MIIREVTLRSNDPEGLEFLWGNKYKKTLERQKGFVQAFLLKLKDEDEIYQMLLMFESEQLAGDWRASSEHNVLSPQLANVASVVKVEVFFVAE